MSSAPMTRLSMRSTRDPYSGMCARQTSAARLTLLVAFVLVALQIATVWTIVAG